MHAAGEPLGPFAARVAHDLNNLLTGILGNLELLQLRAQREGLTGLDGYLEGANSAAARAAAFAQRLIAYSGEGKGPADLVALDAFLARFAPAATCRLAAPGARVRGDAAQLEFALNELLANARHANGQVFISSAQAGAHAIITVRDTGHGMTPDILARAAEPFFSTRISGTGHGLGLPIVARVMRDFGGSMEIVSQTKAGCVVTLRLPCAGLAEI